MAIIPFKNTAGETVYRVQIRRKGHSDVSKNFRLKREAEKFERETIAAQDKGDYVDLRDSQKLTISDLIDRYKKEITSTKDTAKAESNRLEILREKFGHYTLYTLSASIIQADKEEFLSTPSEKTGRLRKPETYIRNRYNLLRELLMHARRWGHTLPDNDIFIKVTRPKKSKDAQRTRRVKWFKIDETTISNEIELLKQCTDSFEFRYYVDLVVFCSLRREDLTKLRWSLTNFKDKTSIIFDTKNQEKRSIPLDDFAIETLQNLKKAREELKAELELKKAAKNKWTKRLEQQLVNDDKIIKLTKDGISSNFRLARERASEIFPEIKTLRLHDLKRESISQLAEAGFSLPMLSEATGNSDFQNLKTYTVLNLLPIANASTEARKRFYEGMKNMLINHKT